MTSTPTLALTDAQTSYLKERFDKVVKGDDVPLEELVVALGIATAMAESVQVPPALLRVALLAAHGASMSDILEEIAFALREQEPQATGKPPHALASILSGPLPGASAPKPTTATAAAPAQTEPAAAAASAPAEPATGTATTATTTTNTTGETTGSTPRRRTKPRR